MLSKGKKRKALEYLLEFFIVIIGICIAFWLGEQTEQGKKNKLETQYLEDLNDDLEADTELIEYLDMLLEAKSQSIQEAITFFTDPSSKLTTDNIPEYVEQMVDIDLFYPSDFTYGSLRQSGDLKLIKNHDLRKSLVQLYSSYESIEKVQSDLIEFLENNLAPVYFKNFDLANKKIVNQAYFKSPELSNFMIFTLDKMSTISVYFERSNTIALEAKKLIEESLK